jgi:SagB-type dehydrogenase family enzyme
MIALRFAGILVLFALVSPLAAETLPLPKPQVDGGMPLMQSLKLRQSTREFSDKSISNQSLGNLLWGAWGVNRPETGGRTAPSAWSHEEIDLYVFTKDGVFLYLAGKHALHRVLEGDHRAEAGGAPFTAVAGVSIVYVADHSRSPKTAVWEKENYAYIHTGFIGQNVYLVAAAEGLGCVIHDSADKGAVAQLLGLGKSQQVIIVQSVGVGK